MAKHTASYSGDYSPELVPVIEPGALTLTLPQPAGASGDELALGDLLSDALFGEVIDISDLVPRMLSQPTETAASLTLSIDPAAEAVPSLGEALTLPSHAEALTILYDDDILASTGTIG